MIRHYPFSTLGKAEHGWLSSSHHFSFAHYYNPSRMGFGKLRVINDDIVKPGTGFGAHPHRNMEIISFVRSGEIHHKDSEGNSGVTHAGEFQVMSAGTGIVHSEYNLSKKDLSFYQIWIETAEHNAVPRWESKHVNNQVDDKLNLMVSGYREDLVNKGEHTPLFINQEARIYHGKISKGKEIIQSLDNQAYVLASAGEFEIIHDDEQVLMKKGDGAEVINTKIIRFKTLKDSEVLLIEIKDSA